MPCDEVFAFLDESAERARKGENVAHLMPLVKQHLDMCPDCQEEYEALVRILAATDAWDSPFFQGNGSLRPLTDL